MTDEIPKGWRKCKLGDAIELLYGKGLKESDRKQGDIPVYGSNGIVGYHNDHLVKGPGIIIGRKGSVGEIKYSKRDFFPIDTTYYVVTKDGNDMKFLYYYLLTLQLNTMNSHSAVPGLNRDNVYSLDILLPPLPEQKAIASVLGSLDDKIDLLHKENQTLEQLAETLFHQWFIEEADDSWEESTIGDIIEILSGFPFKSDTFNESGKYNIITIKAVQDGYLELSNADKINIVPNNMPSYCYLEQGDILLSLTGNVGRCCFVDINNNLLLNQRVAKLKPKNNRDIAYTYIFFRMQNTKQLLEEMAKGTAQPNLSPIELLQMKILIPPTNKLETFAETSNPLIQKLLDNKIHIRTLENLRDTLLPKLMSGEVRLEI